MAGDDPSEPTRRRTRSLWWPRAADVKRLRIANSQMKRLRVTGERSDLDRVIALLDIDDLAMARLPNRTRRAWCRSLAGAFDLRGELRHSVEDFDRAIALQRFVINSHRPGTPLAARTVDPSRANLAAFLLHRFSHTGERADLDDAIMLARQVLSVTPRTDKHFALYSNNLAVILTARAADGRVGRTPVDEALRLLRDAGSGTPEQVEGSLAHARFLGNYGAALSVSGNLHRQAGDLPRASIELQEAIRCLETATARADPADPIAKVQIASLANARWRLLAARRAGGERVIDSEVAAVIQALEHATDLDLDPRQANQVREALRDVRAG